MTVSSDVIAQGTLTGAGTQDTLRTATATEYLTVTFINDGAGAVTLEAWLNGIAAQNRIIRDGLPLAVDEMAVLRVKLGSGDFIKAEASAASSVVYTVEMDTLT